jgi:DNA-binding NarL/FixJ family response regulator
MLESKHTLLTQTAKAVANATAPPLEVCPEPQSAAPQAQNTRAERLRQTKRNRRCSRYEAVMELVRQGVSQCEISRQLAIGRRTVHRWIRAGTFPEHVRTKRNSCLVP